MPRPVRFEVPGGTYLIHAPVTPGLSLLENPADAEFFLATLARACRRYQWRCLAWCLSPGHYRLLLTLTEPSLATGLRFLNSMHAQQRHAGKRPHRPLFARRYESVLVDPRHYLFEAHRRVLMGPVLEGLVDHPRDWPWSSHAALTLDAPAPAWLALDEALAPFGSLPDAARGFAAALEAGLERPIEPPPLRRCLGDRQFLAAMKARARRAPRQPLTPGYLPGGLRPTLAELTAVHRSPRDAMQAAYTAEAYTQREIAGHFGLNTGTVSRVLGNGAA